MRFRYAMLETCSRSKNTVVVIDVFRAFSTAAYAFGAGADSITLVSGVKEALELKIAIPGALVMGEVGGVKVEAFDSGFRSFR
jgi:2-phosphosulfolactate phosphatase